MGWLYTEGYTKQDVIDDVIRAWPRDNPTNICLNKCIRGNRLWTLWERDVAGDIDRYIVLFLLMKDGGYGWGYKDITESMGPVYYDCPLKYVDASTCDDSYAPEWKGKVRDFHASKRKVKDYIKSLKPGDIVTLKEGCNPDKLTVMSTRPFIGVFGGTRYRISQSHVAIA